MPKSNGAADAAADGAAVRDEELQPEAEGPTADDTLTVLIDGEPHEVPAALRDVLERAARHEAAGAELDRRAQMLEAGRQALADRMQAHEDHFTEHARLAALDDQIARLSQVDWAGLQRQDPQQAQALMGQLFQMKQAREIAAGHLHHRQSVRAFEARREHAARSEHAHAVVSREIEGWGPGRAAEVAQFAMDHGISLDELSALADPRLIKILHHACNGHAALQRKSAGARLTAVQAVRPAIQVGGTGGGPKDPNRMSTDDWMRHRRGQVRGKTR